MKKSQVFPVVGYEDSKLVAVDGAAPIEMLPQRRSPTVAELTKLAFISYFQTEIEHVNTINL